MSMYCSLAKEHLLAEHLTSLSKRGVGTLSSVSAFNHKRVLMSCFQHSTCSNTNNGRTMKPPAALKSSL